MCVRERSVALCDEVLDCFAQSMDNSRQNYHSLKLAAALTVLALIQAFSLSPQSPSTQIQLLAMTLPGLGILLANSLEESTGDRVWLIGTSVDYVFTMIGSYVLLAMLWALSGLGAPRRSQESSPRAATCPRLGPRH